MSAAATTNNAALAQQKALQHRAQYTPAEYYAALGIDLASRNPEEMPLTPEEQGPMAEFSQMIIYSSRYSDDTFEYRHVQLPKEMLKLIPERFFSKKTGLFKLLWEKEWRSLGIVQSLGWEHYEVHKPEPHLLLFKKLL